METVKNHKKNKGYTTRTVQGLFEPDGGYAQAITMAKLMDDGYKLEIWLGIAKDDSDIWMLLSYIHFSEKEGAHSVLLGTEDGGFYSARYTDAIRSRVKRN